MSASERAAEGTSVFAHQANTESFRLATLVTASFALIEAAGGVWTHSLTLLGDAAHSFVDTLALLLALLASRLANRPANVRHSFGLGRVEVLMADVNGLVMLALVVVLATAAVLRLERAVPVRVHGLEVVVIGFIGLLANLVVYLILRRGAPTLNLRGAVLHVIGDALGSCAAIVSGGVIMTSGWMPIDPLMSLFIAGLILVAAVRLIRSTLTVLLEGVPPSLDLREVGRALASVPGVVQIHDLHVWAVASDQVALAAHVVVDDLASWDHILARQAEILVRRWGIRHLTLQPESVVHRLEPLDYAGRTPPPLPTPRETPSD